ncbi:MAG TPA: hypothetical protein VIU93_06495 [Gallionellaceae bacterium]
MLKYILAWLPLLLIALFNGALRAVVYGRFLDELTAHQLSSLIGVVLFGFYIRAVIDYWRPESAQQALHIGLLWLAMTVAFEFLFMHYVAGHPWRALLHDYNILAGRVWLLVLAWITFAPYVFYRLQRRSGNQYFGG